MVCRCDGTATTPFCSLAGAFFGGMADKFEDIVSSPAPASGFRSRQKVIAVPAGQPRASGRSASRPGSRAHNPDLPAHNRQCAVRAPALPATLRFSPARSGRGRTGVWRGVRVPAASHGPGASSGWRRDGWQANDGRTTDGPRLNSGREYAPASHRVAERCLKAAFGCRSHRWARSAGTIVLISGNDATPIRAIFIPVEADGRPPTANSSRSAVRDGPVVADKRPLQLRSCCPE